LRFLTKQNKHKTKVLKRRDKSGHNKTHINKFGEGQHKTKIKLNLKCVSDVGIISDDGNISKYLGHTEN